MVDDTHMLRIRTRQLEQCKEAWCKAAELALAGDTRSLWLRVQMHRDPARPEVVLSESEPA